MEQSLTKQLHTFEKLETASTMGSEMTAQTMVPASSMSTALVTSFLVVMASFSFFSSSASSSASSSSSSELAADSGTSLHDREPALEREKALMQTVLECASSQIADSSLE